MCLAAVCIKMFRCGEIHGKLLPQNDADVARCKKMGIDDINRILRMEDLVKVTIAIFAEQQVVTDGELLRTRRSIER